MAITLTEKAAKACHALHGKTRQRHRPAFRRSDHGLLWHAYKLEYVDEPGTDDQVFRITRVKVFVDPKSLPYIDGTELDFAREGLNEGFKFYNPNVKDECGLWRKLPYLVPKSREYQALAHAKSFRTLSATGAIRIES